MNTKYICKPVFWALTILLLFSSCDFLDESDPNSVSTKDYLKTETDVLKSVNGIYLAIRSNDCLGESSTLYTEERSDNTGRNDSQSSSGEPFQFSDFSLLPSNSYLKKHWVALYKGISRANFVLEYIDNAQFDNVDNKKTYIAEAKYLRALLHFHLVRKWGDVILGTTYLESYGEISANTFREKKETVYAQIVQDLKDALDSNLPNLQSESGKGRACKAAINGLLGQVYLTMYTTLSENKSENLTNAKKYLTDCYAMRQFGQLSEIPYVDVFDVKKKSTNPEIIFQIVYKQGDKDYSSSVAANNQAQGETINSQKVTKGGGTFVKPDLVYEYEEADLRKSFSVKYGDNANAKSWFITKFRDTSDAAGTLGYGGNDWILMRYADIILMLAETEMYLGNDTEAIKYLDQVRLRAGLPGYAAMQNNADYKAKYPTLKLAILHERRVELAFENQRWYDLLRFFNRSELVTYFSTKKQDNYGISSLANFGTKDYYYPIPFDEWKLDPLKMWQNEGYE